jgi:hypothetical protein
MNQKTTEQCKNVVASSLAQHEYVELVDVVQIGKVSARKQLVVSVVVGILTLGLVLVALRPRAYFLVKTNQRLLLVDNIRGSVGKKVVLAVPLTRVIASQLRAGGLTFKMDVELNGTMQRFSWGRVQAGTARRVAEALGAPVLTDGR